MVKYSWWWKDILAQLKSLKDWRLLLLLPVHLCPSPPAPYNGVDHHFSCTCLKLLGSAFRSPACYSSVHFAHMILPCHNIGQPMLSTCYSALMIVVNMWPVGDRRMVFVQSPVWTLHNDWIHCPHGYQHDGGCKYSLIEEEIYGPCAYLES